MVRDDYKDYDDHDGNDQYDYYDDYDQDYDNNYDDGRESRRYGYYKCSDCGKKWSSAYTWCYYKTFHVKYGQDCTKCAHTVFAHRVEKLLIPKFKTNSKKPHIQRFCHRCKSRSYSCSHSKDYYFYPYDYY